MDLSFLKEIETFKKKESILEFERGRKMIARTINETFTKKEFKKLKKAKGRQTWHDFIINKCLEED